jgi:hypothetical protein
VNRKTLQALAKERVKDAKALLGRKRWSAAFYLAGYAVECGLKACVLRHIEKTGRIFAEAKYLKRLAGCWTHDLVELVELAELKADLGRAEQANPVFKTNWGYVKDWSETSRYQSVGEQKARELFAAITDNQDGVLRWLQDHW